MVKVKRSLSGKLERSIYRRLKVKRSSSGKLERSIQKNKGEEEFVRKAGDVSPDKSSLLWRHPAAKEGTGVDNELCGILRKTYIFQTI